MQPRGNIALAISHAELVEAVETCAPIVTAKYLADAYDRMQAATSSGMRVNYHPATATFTISAPGEFHACRSEHVATRRYFDAVARMKSVTESRPPVLQTPTKVGDAAITISNPRGA